MNDTTINGASRRLIPFSIDGEEFSTEDISQRASALLQLAGLDPNTYDLGELQGKEHPKPVRYDDNAVVTIHKDARFVSIRQKAPVA